MSTYKLTVQNYQILQKAELTFNQGLTLILQFDFKSLILLLTQLLFLIYNIPKILKVMVNMTSKHMTLKKGLLNLVVVN